MSVSNTHLFFCITSDCGNTAVAGTMCAECMGSEACPDCGDTGATVLGSNYCHECYSKRNHPCNAPPAADGWCPECDMYTVVLPNICAKCQQKRDERCTCDEDTERSCAGCERRLAEQAEYDVWCGVPEPQCECDGSGRMCDLCAEEYAEPCRGCGMSCQLWSDNTYCRKCYVDRYGDEFPPSRYAEIKSLRTQIVEIQARLKTKMTEDQKDDWIWLLQNRRGDLAAAEKEIWGKSLESMRWQIDRLEAHLKMDIIPEEEKPEYAWLLRHCQAELAAAEKEMWEQYDEDDLRKLDLQNRGGF